MAEDRRPDATKRVHGPAEVGLELGKVTSYPK